MMNYEKILSRVVTDMKPSGIRKFFDIANSMEGVISLGVGEPDFRTPWQIRNAGIRSLERGNTRYTANRGLFELCTEISKYVSRKYGVEYEPKDEVLVTVGGSEAIDAAIRAITNPGDEIIIPQPSYVCSEPMSRLAGGVPVIVNTKAENDFKLTPCEIKEAISPKTKAIILPYPCNPTGAIMERGDLEALYEAIKDTDIIVISDEIYAELTFADAPHVSAAAIEGMRERTILINGFSKAFSMTGWRLGYLCAPKEICDAALKIHQYAMMSAPTASQFAAIEALKSGEEAKDEMVAEYRIRRNLFVKGLNDVGLSCHVPQGAFYAFPSIESTGLTDEEFAERLLKEQQVAVVPGSAFGESGHGHIRTCYAVERPKLIEAVRRIGEFVDSL